MNPDIDYEMNIKIKVSEYPHILAALELCCIMLPKTESKKDIESLLRNLEHQFQEETKKYIKEMRLNP